MRRIGFLALALAVWLAAFPAAAARYAAIVVDGRTGEVLHAVNPDLRAYPASLTKLMTLYLVFEALKAGRVSLDQKLTVSARAARMPKSRLGLKRGQTITVRQIIGALVTKSANDAAAAIAEALGGSEARFARLMTVRARQLGMSRTTFRNASGLPDRRQRSTVRDMAKLALALQRDFPGYYRFFSLKSFKYRGRRFRNHNRLLVRYKGTDGLKTGYIRASGFNLAVSVERKGRRLVGVLFGGKSAGRRDRTMITLLNRAFRSLAAGDAPPPRPVPDGIAADGRRPALAEPVALARLAPDVIGGSLESDPAIAWGIQVGAFDRYAPAHLAATRAARRAPELLRLRVAIVADRGSKGRIYRARLLGLSEARARAACTTLKKKRMPCVVVKADEEAPTARR